MPTPKDNYASYLLRLRRVQGGSGRSWMASLQSTATSAEQWFMDIDALTEFLQAEFGECDELADTDSPVERSEGHPLQAA